MSLTQKTGARAIRWLRLPWGALLFNHADAWITTIAISCAVLLIHEAFNWPNFRLALALGIGYWMAFAINDYFDVEVDRLDAEKRRRNFFVQVRIPPWAGIVLFLSIGCLLLPIFLGFGARSLIVMGLSLIIMWGYSAPPLRIKDRPGWDLLTHATFVETFPYLATLFLIRTDPLPLDLALVWLAILTSISAQIENQIRDAAHDAKFGQTFTTRLGPGRANWLLRALTVLHLAYGLLLIFSGVLPPAIIPLGVLIVPVLLTRFWRKPNEPRPERLIKVLVWIGGIYLIGLIAVALL